MEVHHHSHKPKNWKEYITEFIMLFAAVTLGFFAENIREHQVIDNHKNQNLITMIDDLKQDSVQIDKRIDEYTNALAQFEKIKDLSYAYSRQEINENKLIDTVVQTYVDIRYGVALFINNASYKNTISAGSLSFIKNNETKKLIAQYYEAFYSKLVGFGFINDLNEKLPFQTRSNSEQLEDFKTIPALRRRLVDPEFRLLVNSVESRCGYYLYVMQTAKELNTKLLSQLNKKEF
jgi:uncharacterized membrane protein YheB (UPF0754 family)